MALKKIEALNCAVTREELESLSPVAREIAEGLGNALDHAQGKEVEVRETTLELLDQATRSDAPPEAGEGVHRR